jgi:hypothetical protein
LVSQEEVVERKYESVPYEALVSYRVVARVLLRIKVHSFLPLATCDRLFIMIEEENAVGTSTFDHGHLRHSLGLLEPYLA